MIELRCNCYGSVRDDCPAHGNQSRIEEAKARAWCIGWAVGVANGFLLAMLLALIFGGRP